MDISRNVKGRNATRSVTRRRFSVKPSCPKGGYSHTLCLETGRNFTFQLQLLCNNRLSNVATERAEFLTPTRKKPGSNIGQKSNWVTYLCSIASITSPGHTQPPIQWVPGAKASGGWSWPLSSIYWQDNKEWICTSTADRSGRAV